MNTVDLGGLIKGLMVVIGIALALGRLDDLERWAANEAFRPNSTSAPIVPLFGRKPNRRFNPYQSDHFSFKAFSPNNATVDNPKLKAARGYRHRARGSVTQNQWP
jgi:hypothetical protein